MKVIFDTNVFISVLLFRSPTIQEMLFLTIEKNVSLCFSPSLIKEIEKKLKNKFQASNELVKELTSITSKSLLFHPPSTINFEKDPKDSFLLELAEAAKADYLVTGDKKHLLPLQQWKSTSLLSPRSFLDILQTL